MRHIIPFFSLLIWAFSCAPEPALDPLEAARQKLAEAKSISFEMQSVWNNTYVNDTTVNAVHKGVYLRNEGDEFPYDFIYEFENTTSIYLKGQLEDIELNKGRIVTYSEEEAKKDLAYEGSYSATGSPMILIQDTAWTRSGTVGNIVYYDKVLNDTEEEDGHSYVIDRLKVDSIKLEVVAQERIYTLDGKPMQHIIQHYSNFAFDGVDHLSYEHPEGFQTISYAEMEEQQMNDLLKAGDQIPEFDLVDIDGNAFSEKTIRGKKTVFVFSFIGCGGCELARKHLAKVGFAFNEDHLGLYVNPTNTAEQIANYHLEKPWPFKLTATDYNFANRFGIGSYPTFITVDESGTVEEVIEGYDEDEFMDFFEGKGRSSNSQ